MTKTASPLIFVLAFFGICHSMPFQTFLLFLFYDIKNSKFSLFAFLVIDQHFYPITEKKIKKLKKFCLFFKKVQFRKLLPSNFENDLRFLKTTQNSQN